MLLYSQSGAGKTSLINAKLIPLLEEKGFEVLKPGRVRGLRPPDMPRDAIRNIYVFNALRSWDDNNTDPKTLAKLSLTDFLKQRKRKRMRMARVSLTSQSSISLRSFSRSIPNDGKTGRTFSIRSATH